MAEGAKDTFAGIVGGMCLVVAGHPLDTMKVRMQTQKKVSGEVPKFKNAFDCFYKTVKYEGVRGLFKGLGSPLVGVPPIYAVVFAAYGSSKRFLQKDESDVLTLPQIALAGCVTGVATTAITAPVEMIKARLQIQYARAPTEPRLYSGPVDCGVKVFKAEGVRGLFRGSLATMARDVPGSAAYFAGYEAVRRTMIPIGGTANDLNPLQLLFAGGMGGVANWLTIFPVDIVKSRIQTDTEGRYKPGIRGMYQCASEIVAVSGFRGLWVGIGPCLARSFPANAACFLGYEMTMRLFNNFGE